MKVSKRTKTNLKIAVATATCIFTLATAFTGTLTWFSMNQSVSATGMSVKVAKTSNINILSSYAVRYDGTYGAIAYDISGGNTSISMSEYDYVFTDRNVNTPLFIRLEIADFDTSNDLSVTIPCTGTYKTNNKVDPYLSNVVGAKLLYGLGTNASLSPDTYVWSGNNVTTEAVVNSYQGMLSHARENASTPFVTNQGKNNSISLSLGHNDVFNNNFVMTRNEKSVVVVYIVLDYYVTNNVNLIDDYLGSYGEGEQHELSFTSDISTMAIENEDSN